MRWIAELDCWAEMGWPQSTTEDGNRAGEWRSLGILARAQFAREENVGGELLDARGGPR